MLQLNAQQTIGIQFSYTSYSRYVNCNDFCKYFLRQSVFSQNWAIGGCTNFLFDNISVPSPKQKYLPRYIRRREGRSSLCHTIKSVINHCLTSVLQGKLGNNLMEHFITIQSIKIYDNIRHCGANSVKWHALTHLVLYRQNLCQD